MVKQHVIHDEAMLQAMTTAYSRYGIILDPHGALAFAAALDGAKAEDFQGHIVVLATGHPAKHPDLVLKTTGIPCEIPPHIARLKNTTAVTAVIEADIDALELAIAASY
jgi:threonine synthase